MAAEFNGTITYNHPFLSLLNIFLWCSVLAAFCNALASNAVYAATDPPELRVGSELEFPPYAFIDEDGLPAGFSVDLINEVADAMGLSIRISAGPWDTVWNDLVDGRLDVLPLVATMPSRRQLVDFGLPHTETYDAFFVRKGDRTFRDIRAAGGKEIVVMRSDAAHHALLARNFQGRLILVDTIPEGLSLVSSGKHDAFLCSKLIGTMAIKRHGLKGLTAGPPIPDYKRVFSFAVKKGDRELLEKLNQGLMIIKTNGAYDRLYEKWLTVDDPWRTFNKYLLPAGGIVIAVALVVAFWVVILRREVRKRTRELAETNAMLSQARDELEERVARRTAKLTESNRTLQTEISERRLAEDALRRSKEDWEKTFNSVPDMIAIMDNQYRIVRVNKAMADRIGLTAEQCIGRYCYEIVHGIKEAPSFCPLMQTLVDAKEHTVEAYEPRFNGYFLVSTTPMFNEQGQIIGSVHVARDITEHKKMEELLVQNENRLKRAQEIAHLGSWELDLVNNELTWSDEVYRIFGLQPQAFGATYEAFLEAVHTDDRAAVDATYSASIHDGRDSYEIEHRIVQKSTGEVRIVHEKCEHTRDESGRIVRSVGMVHDITELKEAERQIRMSLEEKDMLLREIHHRVKNNMTVIFSLLKLQSLHVRDEQDRHLFEDSMARIKSMTLIHEKLYRSNNLAVIDLGDYISELAVSMFRSYKTPSGTIRLNTDAGNVSLGIDSAIPCGLIVNELVTNSIKHAFPEGAAGEITVSLHEKTEGGKSDTEPEEPGIRNPGCEIELVVSDNGIGMPVITDISKSDSLGMTLIYTLVKQLHGDIEVSRENGTEFRIRFKK